MHRAKVSLQYSQQGVYKQYVHHSKDVKPRPNDR